MKAKRQKLVILLMLFAFFSANLFASQEDKTQKEQSTTKEFTLEQAKGYALSNNKGLKQSFIDVLKSEEKVWETIATGLPHIDVKSDVTYMLTVPDAISQFSSFNQLPVFMYQTSKTLNKLTAGDPEPFPVLADPGQPEETNEDDLKLSPSMTVTVSQLIFSGSYIVGVRASKVYEQFINLSHEKNKLDLLESVTNSYILVLIAQENDHILNNLYENTKKLYNETSAIHKEGLVEETELDQLSLILKNIENTKNAINRQLALAKYLLKYQMGIDLKDEIVLHDKLSDILTSWDLNSILLKNFKVEKNINYKMLENNVDIQDLNLDLAKSAYLPTLAGFYRYYKNFNTESFNMEPENIVGLSLNLNIFSSGEDWSKVKQAKFELEKAKIQQYEKSQALILEFEQTKISYNSAYDKFVNEKEKMDLAEKIYDNTYKKYKEGVSSSLDLTQVHSQYLETQTNYFSSVSDLMSLKTKLEKILKEE
jgi:outer membrane protein TolC